MPFAYDLQILGQPDAVAGLLGQKVRRLDRQRPTLFTGIGSSQHACRVAAYWRGALAVAVEPGDLMTRVLTPHDQVAAVSHRGESALFAHVLAHGRAAGAWTVAVVGTDAPTPAAEQVLRTCARETAGTHSVSYVTALVRLAQLVGLGDELAEVPDAIRRTLAAPEPDVSVIPALIAGNGVDAITASEAALKLKEACCVWTEGMSIEMALHGPLAALTPPMGAIVFTPAPRLVPALQAKGVPVITCGSDAANELRFVPCGPVARALVSVVPVQRYAASLARRLGTNPDVEIAYPADSGT